jgi:predicted dehydrogenase
MKEPSKILFVGINGYGRNYLETLFKETECEHAFLAGVVDPEAEKSKYYKALKELVIPVCSRMNDFYLSGGKADLAVIASPPHFHVPQSIVALHHKTNVLCEVPVSSMLTDVEALIKKRDKTGKFVMIGFQWSYSEGIQLLKKDILAGKFGKPLRMKSMCLKHRDFEYFTRNSWAYRRSNQGGNMIMDNLFNSDMSHYIHNMFFLLGDSMEAAAEPVETEANVARAYPVETYDTGIFRAFTLSGIELLFMGSLATEKTIEPCFRIEFENGFAELKPGNSQIMAKTVDQKQFVYPSPDSDKHFKKLFYAVKNVTRPDNIICPPEAALPQLKLVHEVEKSGKEPQKISQERIFRNEKRLYVKDLDDQFISAYRDFRFIRGKL